jgi:hypothetical protein
MAESKIRYTVIATIATSEYVEEYKSWLSEGHIQALIDEGGALSGEIVVLEEPEGTRICSSYIFPSMTTFEAYSTGEVAKRLRADGIARFVDTQKVVKFERMVGAVAFIYP